MNIDKKALIGVIDCLHESQDIVDECDRNIKNLYAKIRREFGLTNEQIDLETIKHREARACVPSVDDDRVYFLRVPNDGLIKIGFTHTLTARIKALSGGIKRPVELVGAINGDRVSERVIHWQFRRHRQHGEFFSWTPISEHVRGMVARNSALLRENLQ